MAAKKVYVKICPFCGEYIQAKSLRSLEERELEHIMAEHWDELPVT